MSTTESNRWRSFSNGNGPPGDGSWPCEADWQAGWEDDRLLWHTLVVGC